MNSHNNAVTIENLSKLYRLGVKASAHDSFSGAVLNFIKSPLNNYRKYRSLYRFGPEDLDRADVSENGRSDDLIWALKDVSLSIKQGEVLGIIGRNGAGKSTLLKILSRITYPTSGKAEIKGKVSSLLEVGTGFHQELTGRENVYLNGSVLGMKKTEIDRRFDEIIDFSGIERFIDTPVKRYSSGMKVRLAFSVAAHLEPEVLIIDEVLAVGDVDFQKKCLSKMEHVGKQGRTVLFVSHNMPAVTRMCDQAVLLDHGQVVDHGPVAKIVGLYLNTNQRVSAQRVWDEPSTSPGNDVASLRAVRIKNENDLVEDVIDIRKPFKLEMEYDVHENGHVLLPQFGLRSEKGELIFITIDQDPQMRGRKRKKGHYFSRATIPGNLLAEGTILVNCHLFSMDPYVKQFSEHAAIVFEVVDTMEGDSARGDYSKHMPGVVRPLLKWDTQFIPES